MNWNITKLIVNPTEGSYSDVVTTVLWECSTSQVVNGVTFDSITSGLTSVPSPESGFTPYANLTQDQVLDWVWTNGINRSQVETAVNDELQKQINTTPALPWA